MRVVKYGSDAALGPLILGRRVVTFEIGNIRRPYTVHEDLICATSLFFQRQLQEKRKPIEGDRAICHEELDPATDEVTFCRAQCGQNIHEHCMNEWKKSQKGPVLCPVCRQVWSSGRQGLGRILEHATYICQDAMQTSCNWLYTGNVHISESAPRGSEDFGLRILQAWVVSNWLEDEAFEKALVAKFISENWFSSGFGLTAIKYAFEKDVSDTEDDGDYDYDACDTMQRFVIDIYMAAADSAARFRDDGKALPESFKTSLTHELLRRKTSDTSRVPEILAFYTHGEYILEDVEV